jgi:hypothetical protein
MEPSNIPKGQSAEVTPGKRRNLPGIYVHKESGAKFITAEGSEGVIQADALMDNPLWKSGWERVGDVPSRVELLKAQKTQEKKDTPNPKPGTGVNF